jgi:hypothetical protein
MLNTTLVAGIAAILISGTAVARTPPSSYIWNAARPGLTQQAFETDRRFCLLQSLPYFGGANPNALVAASLITCMGDRGWAVHGN